MNTHTIKTGIIMLVILLGGVFRPVAAQEREFTPVYNPRLTVTKAPGRIRVDGRLDDDGWAGAARAGNFAEHYPGDQTRPPVDTEVFVTYDDDNLYVAFVCHDDPRDLRASVCERDKILDDDYVQLCLDTYGEAAWAYMLSVNPYGIQCDAMWASNGGEELGYDLIWESAATITDSGYRVEMAVPFTSLRFPRRQDQEWKVDFYRYHPRHVKYEYSWAAYDRDEACWPCQWGTLTGIGGITPGRGIAFTPAVFGHQTGTRVADDGELFPGGFVNYDPEWDASLWAKYGISSSTTAEVTINPDFSQIEADAGQIDVNTTYAIAYPERRPFFQEGNDIFRTPIRTLYTRAINDPAFAGKATVRSLRTSVGYLGARDRASQVYLASEERSFGVPSGPATSNVLRLRQTVGEGSQIGVVATDQRFEHDWTNSTVTGDGWFRLSPSLRFLFQVTATHVREADDPELSQAIPDADSLFDGKHTRALDGESYLGHQAYAKLRWWESEWNLSLVYIETSPTFQHYVAFMRQNHYRNGDVTLGRFIRFDDGLIETLNPFINYESEWNWDGKNKLRALRLNFWTHLRKAQALFPSQFVLSSENFAGRQYDNTWFFHQDASMSPADALRLALHFQYGHYVARRYETLGRIFEFMMEFGVKLSDRILVQQWLDYTRAAALDDGRDLYEGHIWRLRLSYQVTRPLSVRLVTEYDDFGRSWRVDPLLTYRLSPYSVLFAGMSSNYQRFDVVDPGGAAPGDGLGAGSAATQLAARQFFIKLQYLFQL